MGDSPSHPNGSIDFDQWVEEHDPDSPQWMLRRLAVEISHMDVEAKAIEY